MAYVAPTKQEEEDQNQPPLLNGAGGVIGAGASGMAGGAPMPAGAQPSPTSGSSGSFTNLQNYLQQNQSQAGELAGKVAGQITATGEAGKSAADALAQEGQQAVDTNRVKLNQDLLTEASQAPETVDQDQAKKAEFVKERTAAYSGPNSLTDLPDYLTAQGKIQKAVNDSTLTGTEAGRKQILSDMNGPQYGPGKATLDNLLLSGDQTAAAKVSAAAQPYAHLTDYLSAQDDATRAAAVQAAQEAAATKAAISNSFTGNNGVIPTFQADLNSRVAAAQQGVAQQYPSIQAKMAKGEALTPDELGLLGVSADDLKRVREAGSTLQTVYGVKDPGVASFLQQTGAPGMITAANVATPEDYARSQALQDLMGLENPILDPAAAAQAGTYNKDIVNFDRQAALDKTIGNLTARDKALLERTGATLKDGTLTYGTAGKPIITMDPITGKPTASSSVPISAEDRKLLDWLAARGIGGTAVGATPGVTDLTPGTGGVTTVETQQAIAKQAAAVGLTPEQYLERMRLSR